MDIVMTCPLGNECETIKDNKLHRCRWFVKIRGKDPQSDELIDEFRCSMEWMPLLQIEHSLFERQTGASIESFRNEMKQDNQAIGTALLAAANRKALGHGV
ncbi:MAG: hypothetical protein OEZ39_07400 [Gammaproteobacteria bacterium]|nr:hypothetical protein [Gammaproteobacteria bacterium]MDH5651683.1 hypothetical protein [Gammaproteobacteria bacterium]